jgi:hypothetical protein
MPKGPWLAFADSMYFKYSWKKISINNERTNSDDKLYPMGYILDKKQFIIPERV